MFGEHGKTQACWGDREISSDDPVQHATMGVHRTGGSRGLPSAVGWNHSLREEQFSQGQGHAPEPDRAGEALGVNVTCVGGSSPEAQAQEAPRQGWPGGEGGPSFPALPGALAEV